ncbi:MAG: DUF4912 domain-containing protein [Clostridia bacterium]|nr:DUF4912 domain-containing protein [Clostridia bacterium]
MAKNEVKKEVKKTSTKKAKATSEVVKEKKSKTPAKKTVATKKTTTVKKDTDTKKSTATKKTSSKSTAKPMIAEYYDLPYRYNQTIVKILAQTPTTLFVYWDISDEDRNSLIKIHGDNFFIDTRPILIVHNLTHNYSFEIEINDFANSWYIRTGEPDCIYDIELGRKFNNSKNEYIYINSSNDMTSPNDHILFEHANLGNVLFKNVKTDKLSSKDFGDLSFINGIDKLYGNIYDVYSALYNNGELDELYLPSSGEFYSNAYNGF